MFLIHTSIPDGRDFYGYITGNDAKLVKTWLNVPNSIPNQLEFQGVPVMSFNTSMAPNYLQAKWTTAKVSLSKTLTDTYIRLPNGRPGQVHMRPQWVRAIIMTVQDNPFYTNTGFDPYYRPILIADQIRDRPTAYRANRATLIQLMPIQIDHPTTVNESLAIINISEDSFDDSKEDGNGNNSVSSSVMVKRPRHAPGGSGTA